MVRINLDYTDAGGNDLGVYSSTIGGLTNTNPGYLVWTSMAVALPGWYMLRVFGCPATAGNAVVSDYAYIKFQ